MEISYNLRYQKGNFSSRTLLDKEGEIVIYAKGFRLKGKGASDKGELINFSEIKEFYYRDEKIFFISFNKEKYTLSEVGTLFDQLLVDLYKSRNEFLMDALFMKKGKLKSEFEGHFHRVSKFGKTINKGPAKFRIYEKAMIVLPPTSDAFVMDFNFINFHEFDDFEYQAKVVMDNGVQIFINQMGNDFEFFQEKFETCLGMMYQDAVENILRKAFPHFSAVTLLKLAYMMKGGKAVSLKEIKDIDDDLAKAVEEFMYQDDLFKEKVEVLREMTDDYGVLYGIASDQTNKEGFVRWIKFAIPDKNAVAFSILPRWEQKDSNVEMYVFKVIMEKGVPADKLEDKFKEINEALMRLDFAKDPCYKDKRELKHSPYQYAIRKMPFLRILRKSYVGKASAEGVEKWQEEIKNVLDRADLKKA